MKTITIKQASERAGRTQDTIRAWIRRENIKTTYDAKGRVLISLEDLEDAYPPKVAEPTSKDKADATAELIATLRQTNREQAELIQKLMTNNERLQTDLTNLISQQQTLSGLLLQANNPAPTTDQTDRQSPQNAPGRAQDQQPTQTTSPKKKHRFFNFGKRDKYDQYDNGQQIDMFD